MTQVTILFQSKTWIAVDKPAGLSVHNSEESVNLLQVLEAQLKIQKLYPVHRLDRETSGVQILALDETAAKDLAQQFQSHQVRKIYEGIVAGELPEAGVWDLPLTDKAEGWKNPAGLSQDRKPCETHFRLLKSSKYFSWLEFDLKTGRQHQIRKHCVLSGHALIGDPRYGNPKYNQKIASLYGFQRMAPHCKSITFKEGDAIVAATPQEFSALGFN